MEKAPIYVKQSLQQTLAKTKGEFVLVVYFPENVALTVKHL